MTQNKNIIIEKINQLPGGFQSPTVDCRGRKFRTILFLEDYKIAQFQEINYRLILDWKANQLVTMCFGDSYCSINLGLTAYSFMVAYHDHENITIDDFGDR